MGVLNITTDSFSGDGLISRLENSNVDEQAYIVEKALQQAHRFVDAGVDLLDVGGESTRPGSQPVTVEEELRRVLPIVRALSSEFNTLISIDTYKARVAEAALESGANLVNDVWSLHADPELAGVIARKGAPVVLMHNRSSWVHAEIKEKLGGRYIGMEYQDMVQDIRNELMESVELAHTAGIPDDHIILDPGIGFGKTVEQNLELVDRLEDIRSLGYPLLLGPSRKSFIGYTLDLPPEERLEGTAAAVAIGIARKADIVRVHDVDAMMRVVRMADAITRRASVI